MKAAFLLFLLLHPYQGNIKEEQSAAIKEILHVLSESSLLGLAAKKKHLTKATKCIEGIHPLDFLKEVAERPQLLDHVKSIHKSSNKWKLFIAALSKSFEEASTHHSFIDTVKEFCSTICIDSDYPVKHAEKKEWDLFVKSVVFQIKKK